MVKQKTIDVNRDTSLNDGHKYTGSVDLPKLREVDSIFNERLNRVKRAFQREQMSYIPTNYSEKYMVAKEKASITLQQEFPEECIHYQLLGMCKVQLQSGMFESEDGTIDNSVRSALVYSIEVRLENPDSVREGIRGDIFTGGAGSVIFQCGRYAKPILKPLFDRDHMLIDKEIIGYHHVYYVRDTQEEIERITKKYGFPLKGFFTAIASPSGPYYQNERKFKIWEHKDWVNNSVETVNSAFKLGFLTENDSWGIKKYLAFKERGEAITVAQFRKELEDIEDPASKNKK